MRVRPTVRRNCRMCGQAFDALLQQSHLGRGVFCSHSCVAKHRWALWRASHNRDYRPIPSHQGYAATSDGRVWRETSNGGYHELNMMVSPSGRYSRVCIRRKHLYVHRLVLEAFHGPCPEGMLARHLNGICTDNRAENLAWGTPQENMDDRKRHGTNCAGVEAHAAKLDDKDVRHIRRLWADGVPVEVLADCFEVKPTAVMRAVQRVTWGHVN